MICMKITSVLLNLGIKLVPGAGLEPAQPKGRGILKTTEVFLKS